jgi:hypothetical protein
MRTIIAAVVAVALAVLVGVVALSIRDDGARRLGAATSPSYAPNWVLFDGGTRLGAVKNLDCGDVGADVVSEAVAADKVDAKTIGPVKYAPCRLEIGLRLPQSFYAWLADPTANKGPKALELVGFGTDGKPKESIRLSGALPTHVEFGALDAADGTNRPVVVEVTLAASPQARSAESAQTLGSPSTQKIALSKNFGVTIDGVEVGVVKVDGWSFDIQSGKAKLGHLVLSVPEGQAATIAFFGQWAQKFLVDGNSGPAAERALRLRLLTSDLQSDVAVIDFQGVGIFNVDQGAPTRSGRSSTRSTSRA